MTTVIVMRWPQRALTPGRPAPARSDHHDMHQPASTCQHRWNGRGYASFSNTSREDHDAIHRRAHAHR